MKFCKRIYLTSCLLLLCSAAVAADAVSATTVAETEFDKLDKQFWQFTAGFYPAHARSLQLATYKTIEQLDAAITGSDPIQANATVVANLALLKKNIENPKIINNIGLLLEQNDWQTASTLYNLIREEGSKTLIANIAYQFAQYQFEREHWQEVIGLLDGIVPDLPQTRAHHALLMHGIALQHLKQHRAAIKIYEKVPAGSRYYLPARLNMAVANIRQDWWTDAHVIINALLKNPSFAKQDETLDRLYTTLGYSFLQQQYYRNSRDAFRNVGQSSPYANRALLGIALTAANQEDYIGALNAVRLLKERKETDLPVAEAFLLMPYFYEKLGQSTTASAGYDEAVQYYSNRLNALGIAKHIDVASFRKQLSLDDRNRLTIQQQQIEIRNLVPQSFIRHFRQLDQLRPLVEKLSDKKLSAAFAKLDHDYTTTLHKVTLVAIDENINQLTHYMNQSRYGIARLIDKPEAEKP